MSGIKTVAEISQRPITDLQPYAGNARVHTPAQIEMIAESIRTYGFNAPIIVDESGLIIAGHGRVLAARSLGMERVPCVEARHLTPDQVRAYRIVDNQSISTEWDTELLMNELHALAESMKISPRDLGFSDEEIAGFVRAVEKAVEQESEQPQEDEFTEDDAATTGRVQFGDVWALGEHRLMCGDSTDADDVARLVDGATVDLCVTDPPYNVDYGRKKDWLNFMKGEERAGGRPFENDSVKAEVFGRFLHASFANVGGVMKPGGAFYCFYSDFQTDAFRAAIRGNGFKIAQTLVWIKSCFVMGRSDYQWQHEMILYGWKAGGGHYFAPGKFSESSVIDDAKPRDFRKLSKSQLQREAEQMYFNLNSRPSSAVRYAKPMVNDDHPTMKPVTLCGRFIANSSRRGERVLDPFCGSGSTLIACDQIGRIGYTMDIDPKYAETTIGRWEKASRQTAELIYRAGELAQKGREMSGETTETADLGDR